MNKKIITGIILGVVIISAALLNIARSGNNSTFGKGPVYNVEALKVERGSIFSYIYADGVLEALEKDTVYFESSIKVKKVLVEENTRVLKGQEILEADISSLESELKKLEINREIQVLNLDKKSMDAELTRARNTLESARRAYNESLEKYEKNKDMVKSGAVSQNEYEMSQKAVTESKASLENAQAAYDAAISSSGSSSKSGELNIELLDYNISEMKKKINEIKSMLYSPSEGIVYEININEGAYIQAMQPAYSVLNPEKLQARASVNEFNIKNVSIGQRVIISGDAIKDEEAVTGIVKSISPVARSNGQEVAVDVVISLKGNTENLKPGLRITCDIATDEKEDVPVISMEAVNEDRDGSKFVYVIDEDKEIMNIRYVKLGIFSDMQVEILEGLSEGELVVPSPLPVYKDGARVRLTQKR